MKKHYISFGFILLALAFMSLDVNSQVRYVDVDPGIGTLNDSISGDTTDLGERIDPENTVYRLQRGETAYYGLTGSISNSGYPLTIMAVDGDGARPFLQPRVVGDGASRAFRPKGDITLMGLHVTNKDELGGQATRMLRCSEDDITVIVDDCWFDKDGQSFIRVDNPGMTFKITNSVISNIGYPNDPNNGRGIDDRGNAIDTIIFENCTFYNVTSRILRDDGGELTYCRMNNNTFVNIGQRGITFGPTGMLELHNNIFMNVGFMPQASDDTNTVFDIDSIADVAPTISVKNNSVYLDTAMVTGFLNDTTVIVPLMNPTMLALVLGSGDVLTMKNENITFTDGPPFNDSIIYYDLGIDGLDQSNAPFWAIPALPAGPPTDLGSHLVVPYDFGYANSVAYSGATDGMQLGDRNWMASPSVGIKPVTVNASTLSIYPMPAHQRVTLNFTLETEAYVQVEVFNLVGKRVADVINSHYQSGTHEFDWNFGGNLESGMYLLRLNTGAESTTTKMIVE